MKTTRQFAQQLRIAPEVTPAMIVRAADIIDALCDDVETIASAIEQATAAAHAPHLLHNCEVSQINWDSDKTLIGKWMCGGKVSRMICGIGDTPESAATDYDNKWRNGQ